MVYGRRGLFHVWYSATTAPTATVGCLDYLHALLSNARKKGLKKSKPYSPIMEEIVLNWRGAFKFHTPIPSNLNAAVGLYLLEYNSRILYVGKAKDQGGFKRAKDHLRGYMDSTGRCAIEEAGVKSKDEINLWIGWIEEDRALSLIDDAEKLLTFDRDPPM